MKTTNPFTFNLFNRLFVRSFPNIVFMSLILELKKLLQGCSSVLDLGCGAWSPISYLDVEYSVGIDICEEAVNKAKRSRTHNELCLYDVRAISKKVDKKSFDCCVAIDVIEHLTKNDGYKLINDMENISKKIVIILTPNGFIEQDDPHNPFQKHLSEWHVNDLTKLGYTSLGMFGHKSLRGEMHNLRFRPKVFWGLVSAITNYLYARKHPEKAAAPLYSKNITGS